MNKVYKISQVIMDILFQQLKEETEQLRIMIVLIGSEENISITEQWMLNRTGLDSLSYNKALKQLEEKEFITITKEKIIVNLSNIS